MTFSKYHDCLYCYLKHQAWSKTYKIWCDYAYENLCLKQGDGTGKGTQIDLVIDRNDHIINLCEVKFYNVEFTVTKEYAQKLRDKIRVFQESTKTKKQIQLVLITTFGLKHN
ncbi:MAG: hypothetical protein ACPG49_11950, partial [Chitinophagales bacterium]